MLRSSLDCLKWPGVLPRFALAMILVVTSVACGARTIDASGRLTHDGNSAAAAYQKMMIAYAEQSTLYKGGCALMRPATVFVSKDKDTATISYDFFITCEPTGVPILDTGPWSFESIVKCTYYLGEYYDFVNGMNTLKHYRGSEAPKVDDDIVNAGYLFFNPVCPPSEEGES